MGYSNKQELLNQVDIIFPFGSRVYGTNEVDSDYDLIAVLNKGETKLSTMYDDGNVHYIIYENDEFIRKIVNHDISAMESIFLPTSITTAYRKMFVFDEHKLRESISTISNNSWVKGKKKLIISGDYDKKAALKSIFHSIRIVRFGIQIARNMMITDYSEVNWLWFELKKLGEQYDSDILWEKIDSRYRELWKKTLTEFRSYASKDLTTRDISLELTKVLKKYDVFTPELHHEIWQIFDKKAKQ